MRLLMNIKKFLTGLLVFVILLSGCSNDKYIRSNKQGTISQITLNEMIEKMEKKETFSVAFTTSYCSYCAMFYNVFNDYIKDHEVTMYFIILDEETTNEQENIEIIHRYFPEFYTTPGIFYAENGKEKDYLDTYHLGISKEVIDEWVIKNQLDKEK